ncbi:biotin-requiring enzyme family protein [Rhodococcus sp. BP-149]|uniref:lipoyl domain-containing protein n=1 Tax=unclassified Rhodococcus (in: high G+C Gram-positive bacteria) TaxID=192944 RepID=UPI001C9A5529|nr:MULTISPECIES: biotin/lipoyl-containing protein [unclassified Rhodococcus (in: high G+C Gram-positive bacteria)]MBY6687810.1 biotin-requiring enzyme family protein [Rhodococcus sp. BP-288]MBY6696075.1 biotin-requiring enzyme family protein [Rhodococcus sp. BP-188]MBY6700672.1 biotin-requiring enzyme family protein [Rhodococcus sp. BP-285]MBY6705069.1 biotin-requiring enzyme family protein [Rhodococcus sp. BP-283]MBY6713797.1 biotin-requiring enzyme family protein [Rhodococcus sp. BP-160]
MSSEVSVQIPKLNMAATEATFVGWLVEDGASVVEEEAIYTAATDKVEVEIEAPATGILRHGTAEEDEEYEVGTEIGKIEVG